MGLKYFKRIDKVKKNTLKFRIFKYNFLLIILLIASTTIIFNVAVRTYIEKEILVQLNIIAINAEKTIMFNGPDFFPSPDMPPPPDIPNKIETDIIPLPDPSDKINHNQNNTEDDFFRFYFMLDRSLSQSLSVLNANYILLGNDKKIISPLESSKESYFNIPSSLLNQIVNGINKSNDFIGELYLYPNISGNKYVAIVKPVSEKNNFGLRWIVIYSSLEKVNQLQNSINIILFSVLAFFALIIMLFSSIVAKKISLPLSSLALHIKDISKRNFGYKISTEVDEELIDIVESINMMTEKLDTHDKAQKTFLQNVSHEFRTPLMSIQSYAEGIKYGVVDDTNNAIDIILSETRRIAVLVEELLYLSRLDSLEENFNFTMLDIKKIISNCINRFKANAMQKNISINMNVLIDELKISADEEKLSRAITNILSNCIRYAQTQIQIKIIKHEDKIEISISDDGPGFLENEIPNLFNRFYKGKNGNYGLGLAITKSIIEKHNGSIIAQNSIYGAEYIINI